jgi:hypothetical protein
MEPKEISIDKCKILENELEVLPLESSEYNYWKVSLKALGKESTIRKAGESTIGD